MRWQTRHQDSESAEKGTHQGPDFSNALQKAGIIIPQFEEEYCTEEALEEVIQHVFVGDGERHSLGKDIDWLTNPARDIEWLIVVHKCYFAPGLARQYANTGDKRYLKCFESLILSWINQVQPGFIATEVTARRVQNWIYAWYLFNAHDPSCLSRAFRKTFVRSVTEQVDFICENLAPARNHRTLELYAVFLASIVFPRNGIEKHWRELAVEEMPANIRSDLLPDGVHCELSTDYHHTALRSFLLFVRLARINQIGLPHDIPGLLCGALDFAAHIHRPDGEIPALSDSDSKSFHELLSWGADLFGRDDYAFVATAGAEGKPPARSHALFKDSGYVVLRSSWENDCAFRNARYLAFDCGPVGAGNHGHLDALSIEVAAYGHPLIVDPGRYTYDEQGDINWRARFRGTAAHSTITIDDCDQAIYRQRGARRKIADPQPVCTIADFDSDTDMAYVHGFVESPMYEAVHHRHIWFPDNRYWLIVDQIRARQIHDYKLRYQLAPVATGSLEWTNLSMATRIDSPGMTMVIAQASPDVIEEAGHVSPRYGLKLDAPRVCARAVASSYVFMTFIYPTDGAAPELRLWDENNFRIMTVSDAARNDVWQWDHLNQSISFRGISGTRAWKLQQAKRHG